MSFITKPNTTRLNNTKFIFLYPLNELTTKPDKIKKLIDLSYSTQDEVYKSSYYLLIV